MCTLLYNVPEGQLLVGLRYFSHRDLQKSSHWLQWWRRGGELWLVVGVWQGEEEEVRMWEEEGEELQTLARVVPAANWHSNNTWVIGDLSMPIDNVHCKVLILVNWDRDTSLIRTWCW